MTMQPSPDLLDLAEGVAAGTLRADDAERQLRLALSSDHAAESERAVRELRGLIGAAGAVRAHARATREAFGSASPDLAATVAPTPASIATLVPGRVTAGAVHRRSSNGGDGAGRAPRRMWLLAAAALLLVGGALAAGSGLLKLPSVVPPAPAPTLPVAVASPSPAAATPGPVVSPSPAPTDPALAVRPGGLNIGDFRLVSDSVGWVSTPDAIYRTEDLGRTWTAVTPPGRSAASGSQDLFIDPDTAYSFLPGSGTTVPTIAATHDGGATWAEVGLDGQIIRADHPIFWFETPQHGSLIFFDGQKSDLSTVFDTTDGGVTWRDHRGPSMDSRWPVADTLGSQGIHSVLAKIGEPMPGDMDLAKAVIQVSHDAGATWVDRPYPAIPHAFTGPDTGTPRMVSVWGDTDGHIVLAISSIYHSRCVVTCQDTLLYTSADDGRSWQHVPTAAPMDLSIDTQFLSPTVWVLVSAAETGVVPWGPPEPVAMRLTFTSTLDGGANWQTTTQSSPVPMSGVHFATPDIGWATTRCEPGPTAPNTFVCPTDPGPTNRTVLIQTTDGGLTWSSIGE
jgi:photosystem II stability/assembly factor-like uncharacterized protein